MQNSDPKRQRHDSDDANADANGFPPQSVDLQEVTHTDFDLIREYNAYTNVGINKSGKAMLTRETIKLTVVMMKLIMFFKDFYLNDHTELGGLGMVFFMTPAHGLDRPISHSQSEHIIYINC